MTFPLSIQEVEDHASKASVAASTARFTSSSPDSFASQIILPVAGSVTCMTPFWPFGLSRLPWMKFRGWLESMHASWFDASLWDDHLRETAATWRTHHVECLNTGETRRRNILPVVCCVTQEVGLITWTPGRVGPWVTRIYYVSSTFFLLDSYAYWALILVGFKV